MTQTTNDKLHAFMERLSIDPDAKPPEEIFVHVSKMPKPCDHEWDNGGMNPTHCLKCGMDFTYHIFMECP